jgi:hypothetical protein
MTTAVKGYDQAQVNTAAAFDPGKDNIPLFELS